MILKVLWTNFKYNGIIKKKESWTMVMDTVNTLFYHYTSLNVLYSIVANNELWLSNLKNSNDPNEQYLSSDEYNTYVLQKLQVDPYHGRIDLSGSNTVVGNPYGLSLTTLKDDLGQWERYGDQSRGVAIAFDIPAMNAYLKETYGFSLDFGPIKYTEDEKKEYIKSLIADLPVYDGGFEKCWPLYGLYFTIHYAQARVRFKREEFSLEKEYRLYIDLVEQNFQHESIEILLKNSPTELEAYHKDYVKKQSTHRLTTEHKKYAIMRRGINSYLSLDLTLLGTTKSNFIKEIILGPKCTQNIGELNDFLLVNGFSTIVRKSKIEII